MRRACAPRWRECHLDCQGLAPVHDASARLWQADGTVASPLAELDFWAERAADLNGVEAQLGADAVGSMARALELGRSTHASAFARSAHTPHSAGFMQQVALGTSKKVGNRDQH